MHTKEREEYYEDVNLGRGQDPWNREKAKLESWGQLTPGLKNWDFST